METAAAPNWLQLPPLPTPDTHTPRCLSVWDSCPNRFCPVCKYLWGPQAGLGVSESFSPSLPPSQPERSASRKLLSASSGSRTQPLPPCHLVSLVFLPTPARPVPCRSDPAGAHACTRTHTHSNQVKCTYPQLPGSVISLGFLQEPPNPGRLCGSLGVLAVALRPFSLRYPWRPRLPVAGRAREKSGAAGICFGGSRVESRSLGPDFWTLNPV